MRVQYPAREAVSIWVGLFDREDAFDLCTDGLIEPSLKLSTPLSAICEVSFEGKETTVRRLLEGFSGCQSFIDQACEVAALNGIDQANGALVCYYLLCEAPMDQWPGIKFLGTFAGQDVQ